MNKQLSDQFLKKSLKTATAALMTKKTQPIFNSFQEYIEAENMIFKTLQGNMETVTIGSKDIE